MSNPPTWKELARARKAAEMEARRKAQDAREREAEGQLRIDGTGSPQPLRARQEGMEI